MYNESTNPQVIRSLNLLSDAFLDALREKTHWKVTVTEICDRAGVARKTYYRNVDCMLDLIDWRVGQLVKELIDTTDYGSKNAEKLYAYFFNYWKKSRVFLATLYAQGLFTRFERNFVKSAVDKQSYELLDNFLEGRDPKEPFRLYHNAFIVGGLCTMLSYWAAENFETPVQLLVETLLALVPYDV